MELAAHQVWAQEAEACHLVFEGGVGSDVGHFQVIDTLSTPGTRTERRRYLEDAIEGVHDRLLQGGIAACT